MKNLTAAIFLALLFCTVSGIGEESADGFNQNPEYTVPASDKPDASVPQQKEPSDNAGEKTEVPMPQQKAPSGNAAEKTNVRNRSANNRESNPNRGTAYQRRSSAPAQAADNRYGGDLELQEWERRNSPVPTSLPRPTNFRSRSSGISRSSFRTNRIYYRSGSCRSSSRTVTVRSCCGR